MVIDFQKTKERRKEGRGYQGYLVRKSKREHQVENAHKVNQLYAEEMKGLAAFNREDIKKLPHLWIAVLSFESIFFLALRHFPSGKQTIIIIFMAILLFFAIARTVWLFVARHRYKKIKPIQFDILSK